VLAGVAAAQFRVGGQLMLEDGFLAVAVPTGSVGLGASPQAGQPGIPGRGADLARSSSPTYGAPRRRSN